MQKNVLEYLENTAKKYKDNIGYCDSETKLSFNDILIKSKVQW